MCFLGASIEDTQLDMFTAPVMQLGNRASKKYSDPNAWHNQFYSLVGRVMGTGT